MAVRKASKAVVDTRSPPGEEPRPGGQPGVRTSDGAADVELVSKAVTEMAHLDKPAK